MSRTSTLALAAAVVLAAPAAGFAGPPTLRNLPAAPPNVNSYVLTSPQRVKVFLDVVAVPEDLAAAVDDPKNLLLATHTHLDHHAVRLSERFKGKKLLAEAGTLESGDVKVTVVPSSHFDDDIDGHSNTIVVVEVAGVRVAHFGDCGQERLTADQAKAIGRVDVMLGQLENMYSEADVLNRKGFEILAQVGPGLFIPTHVTSTAAVKLLAPSYPPVQTEKTELDLTPALLGKGEAGGLPWREPAAGQAGRGGGGGRSLTRPPHRRRRRAPPCPTDLVRCRGSASARPGPAIVACRETFHVSPG